ncbi:MAG: hypothetical protein EOP00_26575 [Pedobacter sp.]|nr:MAG: hypothetical protein EOP00_26575 [Pedobacter sp.]
MAEQKGIIQIVGTIEGLNFYLRNGKPVVRRSGGGFTGKAIKTKPSMLKVRLNGKEFGAVSRAKKLIGLSVLGALEGYKNTTLHGRLMSMLQQVKVHDLISDPGDRTVEKGFYTCEGRKLMTEFIFEPEQAVLPLFASMPVVSDVGKKCECDAIVADITSFKSYVSTVGFEYFVVDYDFEKQDYCTHFAEKLLVKKGDVLPERVTFEIDNLPTYFVTRMVFLAVLYYDDKNGKLALISEQGMASLRCLKVYSNGIDNHDND